MPAGRPAVAEGGTKVTSGAKITTAGDITLYARWTEGIVTPPAGGTINPAGEDCISHPYYDIDINKWYHLHVDYVLRNQIMQGVGDLMFKPNDHLSRP